ncbi:hypothetical protein BN131_2032 [Cronobacter malonaticus 681]|nr:hypothetical protein BN131_2032 [Cronobacter malonaticus 681]
MVRNRRSGWELNINSLSGVSERWSYSLQYTELKKLSAISKRG